MRNAFMDTVLDAARERDDIYILSGDAGLGVFDEFRQQRPDRFLNLGVAEQNATGFAAGLSLAGFRVYIYNIVPFVLYRPFEQVRNDICYQALPVTLVGIGSGLTYAPQGMTHYSVEDLGLAASLPNLQVFSPADPVEAQLAARHSLAATAPCYVRLAKRGEPDLHPDENFDITAPVVLREGRDAALICHGSIGEEALRAADLLRGEGLAVRVIFLPRVQPVDITGLQALLADVGHTFVAEEHFSHCGLFATLARLWVENGYSSRLHGLGLPAAFIHEVRDNAGMRDHFGLSAAKMAQRIRSTLAG